MIKNQKSSGMHIARMPTLFEAMLDSLMTPSVAASALTKAALVVFGSLLLAASAQFKIPLYPVPVTGQTLVVLLIGMTYGLRLGTITMAAYLFEGLIGMPVFAGGAAGVAVLMGPTGGYLFGFLLAGVSMGYLAERGMGALRFDHCGDGYWQFVIYLCGVFWLVSLSGLARPLQWACYRFYSVTP